MDTKSIDWSKAPEGTNGFAEIGLSRTPVWFGDNWYEYANGARCNFARYRDDDTGGYTPEYMVNIRRRPEQIEPEFWDGKGLPPVGIECDHEEEHDWNRVRILAHTHAMGHQVAVFQHGDDISFSSADYFRPLRSPKWMAYEKEQAAVGSMLHTMTGVWGFVTPEMASEDERLEAVARQLHRDGYRKSGEDGHD